MEARAPLLGRAPHTALSLAGTQPANKMSMSTMNMPMAMKVLPLAPSVGDMVRGAPPQQGVGKGTGWSVRSLPPQPFCDFSLQPVEAMKPRSNKTEDQIRHLLLVSSPTHLPEPQSCPLLCRR